MTEKITHSIHNLHKALEAAFSELYISPVAFKPARATIARLKKEQLFDQVHDVYRNLGGKEKYFPLCYRDDAMEHGSKLILVDEPLVFQRYRLTTLRSSFYKEKLPDFPVEKYRRFSKIYEKEALKAGLVQEVWTNTEAELHFGTAAEPGDFFGNGSPGWKINAFNDFLTDVFAYQQNLNIVRISVYDNILIGGRLIQLRDILNQPGQDKGGVIKYLIRLINV